MYRRQFLRNSAALIATALPSSWAAAKAAAQAVGAGLSGARQPFDYARLKGRARAMADAPYNGKIKPLPPSIANLSWDQWQGISYRDDRSLWAGGKLPFQVRFVHPGLKMIKPVRMYEVADGQAQEIAFSPDLFDYSRSGLRPGDVPHDMGFVGFHLFFHTDWVRDCAAFQGASYFRAVDGDLQYGMSERGLAIDCGLPTPEEFPDFVAYYLERPAENSSKVTVYGLLDSPSVCGAYRFDIDVGDTLIMDIDSALYPRKQIQRLGIAPGTSMFFYAKNDRRADDDWRPEIHDSDGLQMLTGSGESIWRPLVNPRTVRLNSYVDESPRGFGLMQRERNFDQYEDDGVFYDKRPSVWVEPKGKWGKGSVMLLELPTVDETEDNIVAFWSPASKPERGQELLYSYRLYWCRDNPVAPKLATVRATRTGIGGIVGQPRGYFSWRFVIDFAGGNLALLGDRARIEPIITASRGRIELVSARPLRPEKEWRAMFDLVPPNDSSEPINLRLYLALDGQALSETWLYQYTPPPVEQRKF